VLMIAGALILGALLGGHAYHHCVTGSPCAPYRAGPERAFWAAYSASRALRGSLRARYWAQSSC